MRVILYQKFAGKLNRKVQFHVCTEPEFFAKRELLETFTLYSDAIQEKGLNCIVNLCELLGLETQHLKSILDSLRQNSNLGNYLIDSTNLDCIPGRYIKKYDHLIPSGSE